MRVRPALEVIPARDQREGAGFLVHRPFPSPALPTLDPFLLLDELGPTTYAPGEALGAPDHPHRGFETLTLLLEGSFEHADSGGHAGTLTPGDAQWMTAGAGVVHREMPSTTLQREGGRLHAFQLWLNLPRALKGAPPRYQELAAASIPTVTPSGGGGTGRLIAGAALGAVGPAHTLTPALLHQWRVDAGGRLVLPVPREFQVAAYVYEGALSTEIGRAPRGNLVRFGAGDAVVLASQEGAGVLLLGGLPLQEPIAWGGPFVMNTRAEVERAYADYRAGRMGRIPPEIVRA
ncbi:MAG: pirin family protein [Deltaproteobacteria bacterium]|nr:pirin family protein [Deltaproteobacteria bacterium]